MINKEILNLTQHMATKEQREKGIKDIDDNSKIKALLNFDKLPSSDEMKARAYKLLNIVQTNNYQQVLIGGAFYFIPYIIKLFNENNIECYYSFTKREVNEYYDENNQVVKRSVFKHCGLISANEIFNDNWPN